MSNFAAIAKRCCAHPATLLLWLELLFVLYIIAWIAYILYIPAWQIYGIFITFGLVVCIVASLEICFSFSRTFNKSLETRYSSAALGTQRRVRGALRFAAVLVILTVVGFSIPIILFSYKPTVWPLMDVEVSEIGAVNTTAVKLWFRTNKFTHVSVVYNQVGNTSAPARTGLHLLDPAEDFTAVVVLSGLNPATTYEFYAVMQNFNESTSAETNWPTRTVKTMPPKNEAGKFRFSFGSCVLRVFPDFWKPIAGFAKIASKRPDLFLMIGDQIYSDIPLHLGLDAYPPKYREYKSDPNYQILANSAPVYQMYDDHEFFDNWDRGETGLFPGALKHWNTYAQRQNPDPVSSNVNYFTFERGDVAYFVMDTRRYRTPSVVARGRPEDPTQRTMLGLTQRAALINWLNEVNTTAKWKFLVSTVPWSINTLADDSWWGYQHERKIIFDHIINNNISGTILLSADSHWSAAFKLQEGLYEIVSSPIGAFSSEPVYAGPDTQLGFFSGSSYAATIDLDTTVADPTLKLQFFNAFHNSSADPIYVLDLKLSDTTPKKASSA